MKTMNKLGIPTVIAGLVIATLAGLAHAGRLPEGAVSIDKPVQGMATGGIPAGQLNACKSSKCTVANFTPVMSNGKLVGCKNAATGAMSASGGDCKTTQVCIHEPPGCIPAMKQGITPSDSRLKRDIVSVGSLPNGLGLYSYRYIWSETTYVGVMAQEVELTHAQAVFRGEDGYLSVDYPAIGATLMTWDQWVASGAH